MPVPKCNECECCRYGSMNGAIKHYWCLFSQGSLEVHGGKIIPAKKITSSPDWCPLRKAGGKNA